MFKFNDNLMCSSAFTPSNYCYCQARNESGRSMVEMLGVLAVMGVLSVAGVAGFKTAIERYRANELLSEASKRAVIIAAQRQMGQTPSVTDFGNVLSWGTFSDEVKVDDTHDAFELTVSEVSKNICQHMKNITSTNPQIIGDCDGASDLKFVYKNDLSAVNFVFIDESDENDEGCVGEDCTSAKMYECHSGYLWKWEMDGRGGGQGNTFSVCPTGYECNEGTDYYAETCKAGCISALCKEKDFYICSADGYVWDSVGAGEGTYYCRCSSDNVGMTYDAIEGVCPSTYFYCSYESGYGYMVWDNDGPGVGTYYCSCLSVSAGSSVSHYEDLCANIAYFDCWFGSNIIYGRHASGDALTSYACPSGYSCLSAYTYSASSWADYMTSYFCGVEQPVYFYCQTGSNVIYPNVGTSYVYCSTGYTCKSGNTYWNSTTCATDCVNYFCGVEQPAYFYCQTGSNVIYPNVGTSYVYCSTGYTCKSGNTYWDSTTCATDCVNYFCQPNNAIAYFDCWSGSNIIYGRNSSGDALTGYACPSEYNCPITSTYSASSWYSSYTSYFCKSESASVLFYRCTGMDGGIEDNNGRFLGYICPTSYGYSGNCKKQTWSSYLTNDQSCTWACLDYLCKP